MDATKRPPTRRSRKRARKLRRKRVRLPSGGVQSRTAAVESECLLTDRERRHIDHYILKVRLGDAPFDLRVLDYRWWECRRRCGFDPRDEGVYEWWCGLAFAERVELVRLSKGAGMRGK